MIRYERERECLCVGDDLHGHVTEQLPRRESRTVTYTPGTGYMTSCRVFVFLAMKVSMSTFYELITYTTTSTNAHS